MEQNSYVESRSIIVVLNYIYSARANALVLPIVHRGRNSTKRAGASKTEFVRE